MPGILSIYYGSERGIRGEKRNNSDSALRPAWESSDERLAPENRPAAGSSALPGAIRIHREILKVTKGFTNKNFWTPGYWVSTVGLNKQPIRDYIKNQEELDKGRQGLLNLEGPELKAPFKGLPQATGYAGGK